jgi:hypothetical protein
MSDRQIADRAGVTRKTVFYARRRLRIAGFPTPAAQAKIARECVLGATSTQARSAVEIHRIVLDNYGTISVRAVFRHLAWLVKNKYLVRGERGFGYVRGRRSMKKWT